MQKIKHPSSLLVFLIFLFSVGVHSRQASAETSEVEFVTDMSSPYHTISTHLNFLLPSNYYPDSAALAFMQPGISHEQAREAAIMLKQVYDARGYQINFDNVPKDQQYTDSVSGNRIFTPISRIPEIFLIYQNRKWVYSPSSIDETLKLHAEVFPFGTDRLLQYMPEAGSFQFLGLYLWQYLGILLIVIGSFMLHRLLTLILKRLLFRGARRLGYISIAKPLLRPIARPLSLLIVLVLIALVFRVLQLPVEASRVLNFLFLALLPLFATIVFYNLVDVLTLYLENLAGKSSNSLDNNVVPLIRKVLRVFVVIVGGLFILQNMEINITALLAGISIGGLALALAAQDTLKNFFGSIMIFADKPFSVGHWITSGDIDGTVEEVGLRSTRIRTFRNSLTYVPNGKLADSTIDNHGLREYRRFFMNIAITYDTPPNLIEVFVEGLRKVVENHPKTRKDFFIIEFNDMGDFSLKIMFYIFFEVPTWPEELRARHEILLEIVRLAQKLGVRFAFPTQTLHMENFPGKLSLTPQYDITMGEFRQVMDDYFNDSQKSQSNN